MPFLRCKHLGVLLGGNHPLQDFLPDGWELLLRSFQVNLCQVLQVSIRQLQTKLSFNNRALPVKIRWDIGNNQVILSRFSSPRGLCKLFKDSSLVTNGSHGLGGHNISQYFKSALNGKLRGKLLAPKHKLKLLPKPRLPKPLLPRPRLPKPRLLKPRLPKPLLSKPRLPKPHLNPSHKILPCQPRRKQLILLPLPHSILQPMLVKIVSKVLGHLRHHLLYRRKGQ